MVKLKTKANNKYKTLVAEVVRGVTSNQQNALSGMELKVTAKPIRLNSRKRISSSENRNYANLIESEYIK